MESISVPEQNKLLREQQITKTSVIGIIANLCLVAFKALVGLLSHSIAIVLDAVNNLSDAMSSIITIIGIKLAKRSPDKEHPFGHGRLEYFSALLIAGLVFAAGLASLIESVKKIVDPLKPDYSTATLVVICAAIVTKIFLGRYVKKQGERYNSDALVASGSDASFDAIISASTLVCAVLTLTTSINIDGWVGAVISLFIIKAGIEMLMQPVNQIMGFRPDSEVTKGIRAILTEPEQVLGAYDLILHNYGPDMAIGSVHLEVDDTMGVREFYDLAKTLQRHILEKYSIFMTIGLYAVHTGDDSQGRMREVIRECALAHPGVLNVHGVFFRPEDHEVSFDIVIDFSVKDREALAKHIERRIQEQYPRCSVRINIDADYSD